MADKAISELVAAKSVTPDSLFVLQQDGAAKKLEAQTLENWLLDLAEGHGGIVRYERISTSGLVKTYRFTLADNTYMDISVTDGRGVTGISKVSTSGLVDTYRITYNDGSTGTFEVRNGAKGDPGAATYTWIKYASQKPTASSNSFGDVPDAWLGIYVGPLAAAPADWQAYTWFNWKGAKGDPGDPAAVTSTQVSYLASDSGTVIPSGSWSSTVPLVTPGRYLWTRTVLQFNSGAPIVTYSVSRFGIDGAGSVSTVCGVAPDTNGNVPLTAALLGAVATVAGIAPDANGNVALPADLFSAVKTICGVFPDVEGNVALAAEDLNALSCSGGLMLGDIDMFNHRVYNLPNPTAESEAATKNYVDVVTWDIEDEMDWRVPAPTEEDVGKILTIGNGGPIWQSIPVWAAGSY